MKSLLFSFVNQVLKFCGIHVVNLRIHVQFDDVLALVFSERSRTITSRMRLAVSAFDINGSSSGDTRFAAVRIVTALLFESNPESGRVMSFATIASRCLERSFDSA